MPNLRILNDRSFGMIATNAVRPLNYIALARAPFVYEHPFEAIGRYFAGKGDYPYFVRVRTPIGTQGITLFNSQDIITVHEIFSRQDYRCPSPPQTVVDLGSNIGISALYFLTRSPSTYCELYEPDPHNIPKLLENIKGYEDRFALHQNAVADAEGVLPFRRESTGRYGSLVYKLSETAEEISVRVEHINTVLEHAIGRHGTIDLLKIDTEGAELATIRAIDRRLLKNIRNIAIEWESPIQLDGFHVSTSCNVIRFRNESW